MSLEGQILANKDPSHSTLLIAGCMIIAEIVMVATAYVMSRIVNRFNRKTFFISSLHLVTDSSDSFYFSRKFVPAFNDSNTRWYCSGYS